MCGRYRLGRGREAFKKYFGTAEREDFEWSPRFNIAPTQSVPVIRQDASEPKRLLSTMRWGLIPRWSADTSLGAKLINARSETVAEKPSFLACLRERRCLVPADGFYEWKRNARDRQPYAFTLADESVFAFAGIWDRWRSANGETIESYSILTTTPNAVTSDVHDRMPVMLPREHYDLWLDPGFKDVASLTDLLRPYNADEMKKYPVSTRVNDVNNDDAQCSEAIELKAVEVQGGLFG
jgi:putative SOS response-associated peptidase YedK